MLARVRPVILALAAIRALPAQAPVVLPGAIARFSTPASPRIEGTVTFIDADSVVLVSTPGVRTSVRTPDITRTDVFLGHSRAAGARRGALWMSAAGALLGALGSPSQSDWCGTRTDCHPPNRAQRTLVGAWAFGLMGEWIGGIIGADQWKRGVLRPAAPLSPRSANSPATISALPPGLRVRVTAPGIIVDGLEGTVIQSSHDSLVIATPRAVRFAVPGATISEVRRPEKSSAQGARVGAAWGAAIYAPMSPFVIGDATGAAAVARMAFATAWGTGLGALIGSATGAERWVLVP